MKKVTMMVVDDHEIIRYALRRLFENSGEGYEFSIVAEADNGRKAVELARQFQPDLIVMDITMPEMNGIEAARQIRQMSPNSRIIIFSTFNRRQFLRELIQIGVSAYVLKSKNIKDLNEAIAAALRNEVFLSTDMAREMAEDYLRIVSGDEKVVRHVLSPRQKEVLQMMTEGKSTKEIATMLNVTSKAVESVRHRIMQKLEIDNLANLTKYAIQEGLTTLDF